MQSLFVEVEKELPLTMERETDCRETWPKRWALLKAKVDKIYLVTTGSGADGDEWSVISIHRTKEGAERAEAAYEAPQKEESSNTESVPCPACKHEGELGYCEQCEHHYSSSFEPM